MTLLPHLTCEYWEVNDRVVFILTQPLGSSMVTTELTGELLGVGSRKTNLSVSSAPPPRRPFQNLTCPSLAYLAEPPQCKVFSSIFNLTLTLSAVRFDYTNETYNNPQNLWIYSLVVFLLSYTGYSCHLPSQCRAAVPPLLEWSLVLLAART